MKTKNISIVFPKDQFSEIQLQRLASLGKVSFIESVSSSVNYPQDTEVLVFSPYMAGGITKARSKLLQVLDSLPNVKYLVLGSSDYSFVDLGYCKQRGIIFSSVPFYDPESKAEHIIALLLACMRRIIVNDRRNYRRKYYPELGHNFKDCSLGVIGINHVGEKVVELAKALGSSVNIFDERIMRIEGTIRKTLDALLIDSDMITLCLPEKEESKNFLSKERIARLKVGSVVVNIGNRNWVDEKAINDALISRKVDTYAFVAESMGKSPLRNNEYALMLREFNTYTKETLEKNTEALVRNLEGIVRGIPFNKLDL